MIARSPARALTAFTLALACASIATSTAHGRLDRIAVTGAVRNASAGD